MQVEALIKRGLLVELPEEKEESLADKFRMLWDSLDYLRDMDDIYKRYESIATQHFKEKFDKVVVGRVVKVWDVQSFVNDLRKELFGDQ
jgi:hypothetical protein